MKKGLFLLSMCLMALNTFASLVVTFDPAVDIDVPATHRFVPFHLSKDGVDVSVSDGHISSDYFIYKKDSVTISTQVGEITGMVIECSDGPDGFVSAIGDYSVVGDYGIWHGNSQSVTLCAKNAPVHIKLLTVYVDVDRELCYPPRISPKGGAFYDDPVTVTMFCPIAGSTIHYTTDGSDPSTASAVYEGPITVGDDCTVSAITAIDGQVSGVTRQTYDFRQHVFGLGSLRGYPQGEEVTLDYDATVLYADYYVLFLKDKTGYAALSVSKTRLYDGDVIQAGYRATTKATSYCGLPELDDADRMRKAPTPHQPSCREVTIPELATCSPGELVVLRDVTLNPYVRTLTDSHGHTCYVYQEFYFPLWIDEDEQVYEPSDEYVIVLDDDMVYMTHNILYYGLGYDYSGLRENEGLRLRFPTTVLYQHGNYLFVKDCTGYGLIDGLTGHKYAPGDVIPPEIYVKKNVADGEVRLIPQTRYAIPDVEGCETVEPEVIGVNDIGHGYWAHYVALRDVTVTALDGGDFILTDAQGNTCRGRNTFEQQLAEGHYEELLGIVNSYNLDGQTVYGLLPIVNTVAQVGTFNEVYDLERDKIARFTEPLTVIYHNDRMLYAADKEGRHGLLYGIQKPKFHNGDQIRDVVCHWSTHDFGTGSQPFYIQVIIPVDSLVLSGQGDTIQPDEITLADITPDMVHRYVKIRDLKKKSYGDSCYDPDDNSSIAMDNEFLIDMPRFDKDKYYDVIGFLASSSKIFPLEFIEHDLEPYPSGDVNGDYDVNISDISALVKIIIEKSGRSLSKRADVNGDGVVNISDLNIIIGIILRS